jgi:NADH:ubiquinone oxidoreductase subunit 4 (subunit M)
MIAVVQIDLKRIVAYSSVSHMSLGILGLFTFSMNGFIGSNLIMISHTFISSALFLLVGIIYDRFHNRLLNYYTGLINFMPIYSFFLFYFIISNFGFPLSLSFIAEMFIFLVIGK